MATITGKPVGKIGFGMMNLTWRQTPIPDDQAFATMKAALNAGANFWNGGEFYGSPEVNSLQLLNRYFTKYPEDADKVVLSIKGGLIPGDLHKGPVGSRENVKRSIEECLKVLDGKKFLDVWEMARQDPRVPLEETMGTAAEYVKAGKIGGIGISEVTPEQIRNNAAIHPVAAVEVEISMHTPDVLSNGVAKTCAELDIPIVAYSPLGRGLLTGQLNKLEDLDSTDIRRRLPRFQPGNMEKNAELGAEIQKLAKDKGASAAQIAIAWVSSHSRHDGFGTIIPIPGSTTDRRALENCSLVELTPSEYQELEDTRKNNEVVGTRY